MHIEKRETLEKEDVHILTLDDINKLLDWCDKHDCLNLTDDLIKQILEE